MDALISLLSPFWGWIGGAAAIAIGLLGAYFKVKSTGKAEERQDWAAAVNKQQSEARAAVREVEDEINQATDSDLLDRAGQWVRRDASGRH